MVLRTLQYVHLVTALVCGALIKCTKTAEDQLHPVLILSRPYKLGVSSDLSNSNKSSLLTLNDPRCSNTETLVDVLFDI